MRCTSSLILGSEQSQAVNEQQCKNQKLSVTKNDLGMLGANLGEFLILEQWTWE